MDTNQPDPPSDSGTRGPAQRPPGGVSATRRKLVKSSAFAPPVILTLRSGSVMAQASAATCLVTSQAAAQEKASADPEFEAASAEDGFLRSRVLVREARRVRKKNGKYRLWGKRSYKVYVHQGNTGKPWTSLRPGKLGKKFKLEDESKDIEVYDARGATMVLNGRLMHRRGYPMRRFVGIQEQEFYGLVQTDKNGEVLVDPETKEAMVGAVVDPAETAQSQNVSASCWASLGVTSSTEI
ncbi:hypothetical protein [Methylomagnum sp.]